MKISLWQQFSSNHSGSYRIVGVFNSEVLAQNAYATFNDLMLKILELNQSPERFDNDEPTTAEIEYAQKYGIEWKETIHWLLNHSAEETPFQSLIDDHMSRFGQNIAIDSEGETIAEEDDLIRTLIGTTGAAVYHTTDRSNFDLRFICHAPDQTTAQLVYESLLQYQQNPNPQNFYQPPPWTIYHPRAIELCLGLTQSQYLGLVEAWRTWCNNIQSHAQGDDDFVSRQLWRFLEETQFLRLLHRMWGSMFLPKGTVILQDQQVEFQEVDWEINLLRAMPALHAWLVALGCIVVYEFTQDES